MIQKIEKTCTNSESYIRRYCYYQQARKAFGAVLDKLGLGCGDKILMPAYIGWSEREGSGVFDPINERRITPVFYHLDKNLAIKYKDCVEKIINSGAKVFLVIHYFGFVDKNTNDLIALARNNGLIVIEDAAHALYSDLIGNVCGKAGHYTLYSLHKMLPYSDGGVLVSNGSEMPDTIDEQSYDMFKYDYCSISEKRRDNYKTLEKLLRVYADSSKIKVLFSNLPEGVVPQTMPIVLNNTNRDKVYARMNELGWGIVSLYHTMISPLRNDEYVDECWLSRHITNLPVHQDVDPALYKDMIKDLVKVVDNLSKEE